MPVRKLRLPLVVRRNALPDTPRVLFVVSLEEDPTIANLLQQIDQEFPLKADNWGLEDYVVELRGSDGAASETLHYQRVEEVLRDGEEICVRPLLETEIKKRRFCGRQQISTSGRHLIDGVPFGRPRLGRARDRPPLDIPPRKRRRLLAAEEQDTHDEDDSDDNEGRYSDNEEWDDDDDENQRPLQLMEHGEPEGGDDEEFDIQGASEIEDDELAGLLEDARHPAVSPPGDEQGELVEQMDEHDSQDPMDEEEPDEPQEAANDSEPYNYLAAPPVLTRPRFKELKRQAKKIRRDVARSMPHRRRRTGPIFPCPPDFFGDDKADNMEICELFASFRVAFPSCHWGQLMTVMNQHNHKGSQVYRELIQTLVPQLSYKNVRKIFRAIHKKPRGPVAAPQEEEEEERGVEERADPYKRASPAFPQDFSDLEPSDTSDSDSVSSIVRYFDEHGFPPGSIEDGSALGHMAVSQGGVAEGRPRRIFFDQSSCEDEADDEIDEPEDQEDDSEYEKSDEVDPGDAFIPFSSASEPSDSESESQQSSSAGTQEIAAQTALPDPESSDSAHESDEDKNKVSAVGATEIPDENGDDSSSDEESSDDDSSADDSSDEESDSNKEENDDYAESENEDDSSERDSSDKDSSSSSDDSDSSDDEGPEEMSSKGPVSPAAPAQPQQQPNQPQQPRSETPDDTSNATGAAEQPRDAEHEGDDGTPVPRGNAKTRSRNARRRFLKQIRKAEADTSALSDAAPAADALEARKQALLEALGVGNVPDPVDAPEDTPGDARMDDADPEAWMTKINYRAVECVEEGVELSEPPFPFVQRWDPQQRAFGRRKAKRHRADSDYYQTGNEGRSAIKKLKFSDELEYEDDDTIVHHGQRRAVPAQDVEMLNYDEAPVEDGVQTTGAQDNTRSVAESQFTDLDDLPSLPADVTTLPLLKAGEVEKGMLITWKQWLLSETTGWQPEVIDVSAIVVSVGNDTELRVVLARRDRDVDRKKKRYDEATGERIYGRFEVPDEDSGDEAEDEAEDVDDGWRTLEFAQLVEPRLLQQPIYSGDGNAAPVEESIVPDSQSSVPDENAEADGAPDAPAGRGEPDDAPKSDGPGPQQTETHDSVVPDTNQGSVEASHGLPEENEVPETNDESMDWGVDADSVVESVQAAAGEPVDTESAATEKDTPQDSPSRQLEDLQTESAAAETSGRPSRESSWKPASSPRRSSIQASTTLSSLHGPLTASSQDVVYPRLASSSAGSVLSGRQPDEGCVMVDDNSLSDMDIWEVMDESQVDTPKAAPRTPTRDQGTADPPSVSSSSSLPSISTIWHTCPSTSRATRSPSKPMGSFRKDESVATRDREYRESMRRLDDSEDEALVDVIRRASSQRAHSISADFPSSLRVKEEEVRVKKEPATFGKSVSPPSLQRQKMGVAGKLLTATPKSTSAEDPWIISSSPEPEYTEHYADDDVDEDYEASMDTSGKSGRPGSKTLGLRGISAPIRGTGATRPARAASARLRGPSSQGVSKQMGGKRRASLWT